MPANKPVQVTKVFVAKIYPAEPGPSGKPGKSRILDKIARRYYRAWPNEIEEWGIQEGGTYGFSYTEQEWNNKLQYDLVGAQPVTGNPVPPNLPPQQPASSRPTAAPAQTSQADREIGIVVLALAKCVPSWFSQVDQCDSAGVAQILDALELAWKMHKKPKVAPKRNPEVVNPVPEFNDDIQDSIPY